MTTAAQVIAEAKKHVGYVEGARKDNMFGKWYGMNGAPWCAMFASYCIAKAGGVSLIKGAQNDRGFASCGSGIKFFKAKKAWFHVVEAQPGDLAFFDWEHDGEQDHVGIVVSNDPKTKTIKTIEGNTSDKSHSNGGTVQAKTRNYSVIMGVGRPAYAKAATAPAAPAKAPEQPVKPAQPAAKAETYKVKAGDSYWAIAEAHGIDFQKLQVINNHKPLHPNDIIKLK